jgi:hypothetical protein
VNKLYVKIFTDYLQQLSNFLVKIESYTDGSSDILEARLIDDMFPLLTQAEIAASFSLRTCCPMAKIAVVSFKQKERTFSGIQKQLKQTIVFLNNLEIDDSNLSVSHISDMAGPVNVTLPADEFINRFALPNFFFHLSMVYAIARAKGVPATKGDYDGFHQYPVGFSFEK